LSELEGYFSVHNFSNAENIVFALLKVVPHVKYWWDTYCEKNTTDMGTDIFGIDPNWASFMEALKDKYYHVGNYDGQYTKWSILCQERDQSVPEYTNKFHSLRTKIGIKDSGSHLVLKYWNGLHR